MTEAATIGVEAVVIPFSLFVPLIKDVAEVLVKIVDLYQTAQHNKRIAKLLSERIEAANTVIKPLKEDKLKSPLHYANLQRLVLVLKKMEAFCEEITQYNKLQKILEAKSIESKYRDLCEDYDSSVNALSFSVNVSNLTKISEFKANAERDLKILREEVHEVLKFQTALFDSMVDANKKADEKLDNANEKLDVIVKQVGEMHDTMQILQSEKGDKDTNQKKIDNIFNEVPLPFNDYQEADELPRSERLRKYTHIRTYEEYALKLVDQVHIDQVKNQVTILKKIQTCQNVIRFYGITEDTDNADTDDHGKIVRKYYLITEWAEKGNLYEYIDKCNKNGQTIDIDSKLRFAFDIAKGLNFLNTVKIVHRDIRSENVVITDRDVAKITNFKLSRGFNEATGNLRVEKEGVRHNSPEMLRRGLELDKSKKQKYDTKCEVYSFGILLWELAECKIAYQKFEDFVKITEKVMEGYREPFSPNTDVPEKYKQLVTRAVDDIPGNRPTFANILINLQDIYKKEHQNPPPSRSNSESSNAPNTPNTPNTPDTPDISDTYKPKPSPVRKESLMVFNWNNWNPQTMTIEEAIKHHDDNTMDKKELYKWFDSYATMGNPKGKYWKAYYITKGYSDLKCTSAEKIEIATELYKEVADYGDEFPEAQLRYSSMIMNQKKGPTDEAMDYLIKAAKNGHPVAMFNVATYYFGRKDEELGRYYMIKSANKRYKDAIRYCKEKNIPLI